MAIPSSTSDLAHAQPSSGGLSQRHSQFFLVLVMDLLARTGYQLGKKPLLPLFAAALGASTGMTGFVVATSTLTGLFTSTLIGTLSDRYGRRPLVLAGTGLFAFMPFAYLLISTPGQLLGVRLIHGFATAIYGPVLSALVVDLFHQRRGEYMGWYRAVRTSSYFLGPLLGGVVLFYADFQVAWAIVGLFGLLAFLPALALSRDGSGSPGAAQVTWRGARRFSGHEHVPTARFIRQQIGRAFRSPALLTLGIVQVALYLGLRASDTFLPLYALSVGVNKAQVGAIFSMQIGATLLAQPVTGRLADHVGRRPLIAAGLLTVGLVLPLIFLAESFAMFVILGIVLGVGEAAIGPSIATLGAELSDSKHYGSTLGMLDAMDNVGKAAGPVIAGLLLGLFSYVASFTIIAGLLVVAAALFVKEEGRRMRQAER